MIIKGNRNSFLGLGSFFTGFIVSFIEIVCTGQIYLPIIYYIVSKNGMMGYFYLFIYNLFFIIPLVVVALLAQRGLDRAYFRGLFNKNVPFAKFFLGVFFLFLAVVLLFI